MTSPKHLSPWEFSQQSGLSIASVRRYLRDGKLPFAQPGGPRGRILMPADALRVRGRCAEHCESGEHERRCSHCGCSVRLR